MSKTSIEWTGKVWNPATGCNKVSQGCKNCYAEIMHRRLMHMKPDKYNRPFLAGAFEYEPHIHLPLTWKKPTKIFPTSMSDLFHENISIEYIAKCYAIMFLTPHHTYQMLTKRPERRLQLFTSNKDSDFFKYLHKYCNLYHHKYIKPLEQELYFYDEIMDAFPFNNVWEGTSIEDQKTANERLPLLLQTPAAIRWVSFEPLLGNVNMAEAYALCEHINTQKSKGLDWAVIGGESGRKKRPFEEGWARNLLNYCRANNIAFFMKQIDKVRSIPTDLMVRQWPHQVIGHVECPVCTGDKCKSCDFMGNLTHIYNS